MASMLLALQMWCYVFAIFVAISSMSDMNHYPYTVRKFTRSSLIPQILSITTIIACSIALFETTKLKFGKGMRSQGMGGMMQGGMMQDSMMMQGGYGGDSYY